MDGLEKNLAALLAGDAPPARDPAFGLGVMARIERQRLGREMAGNAAIAACAAAILFGLSPMLGAAFQSLNGDLIATLVVVGAALVAMQWSLQAMDA